MQILQGAGLHGANLIKAKLVRANPKRRRIDKCGIAFLGQTYLRKAPSGRPEQT